MSEEIAITEILKLFHLHDVLPCLCPRVLGAGKGHVFTLTSALADKTAMTVLLETQGTNFTAWELWASLTATDITAMLILPGKLKFCQRSGNPKLSNDAQTSRCLGSLK